MKGSLNTLIQRLVTVFGNQHIAPNINFLVGAVRRLMAKRLLKVFIIDASLVDTKAFPDNTDAKGKEGYYFTLEVIDSTGQSVPEYRFKSKAVRSYSIGWQQNCQFPVPNQGLGTQFKALKSVYTFLPCSLCESCCGR